MEYRTRCSACRLPGIAPSSNAMGNRLPVAPASVASYQEPNHARAYTKLGFTFIVLRCVHNQDTGQRNSASPTAPLDNQQNDPVVYLHFGELTQCLCVLPSVKT